MVRASKKIKKRPLIVICTEGGQNSLESQYLSEFKNRNFRLIPCTGNNTDVEGMYKNLCNHIKNEDIKNEDNCRIFLILDTDLSIERINKIKSIEAKCKKKNIEIITSSPTFEIWLLMHFKQEKLTFDSSAKVKKEYSKIREKRKDFKETLKANQDLAIEFAKKIENESKESNEYLSKNPHSSIYKIVELIKGYE